MCFGWLCRLVLCGWYWFKIVSIKLFWCVLVGYVGWYCVVGIVLVLLDWHQSKQLIIMLVLIDANPHALLWSNRM